MTAWAGSTVGNGGAGLLCGPKNAQKVETLDTYEARVLRQMTFDLGPASDVLGHIKYVLDRFAKTDSDRAARYWARARGFMTDSALIPDAEWYRFRTRARFSCQMDASWCRLRFNGQSSFRTTRNS